MRTIIAGSRGVTSLQCVDDAMRLAKFFAGIEPSVVVSGRAPGVDRLGEQWAKRRSIPVDPHPAAWRDKDGGLDRSAGHKRNAEMAAVADALVAIWDGSSPGTRGMIDIARKRGLKVYVYEVCT